MSSGWLNWAWYLIRMSYGSVIMSSGWDTLPVLSHPDEIANFDFPHHAVALQRFRSKNMMLLFENKLSYIFCVVGAGVTNAESAWWLIKLNQRCWLACLLCVIFYHVFCEIWINCGYVWLRCCRIGDKCVVLFLKMWEIGVCSITKI